MSKCHTLSGDGKASQADQHPLPCPWPAWLDLSPEWPCKQQPLPSLSWSVLPLIAEPLTFRQWDPREQQGGEGLKEYALGSRLGFAQTTRRARGRSEAPGDGRQVCCDGKVGDCEKAKLTLFQNPTQRRDASAGQSPVECGPSSWGGPQVASVLEWKEGLTLHSGV